MTTYTIGQSVQVPYGRQNLPRAGRVVAIEHKTWGPGQRPANAQPGDRFTVLRVDLGGRIGVRGYTSDLATPA